MSGGVSLGAGGASGGWSPLQVSAGLDPARGSASPGYVERGSSGVCGGCVVGRLAVMMGCGMWRRALGR